LVRIVTEVRDARNENACHPEVAAATEDLTIEVEIFK